MRILRFIFRAKDFCLLL